VHRSCSVITIIIIHPRGLVASYHHNIIACVLDNPPIAPTRARARASHTSESPWRGLNVYVKHVNTIHIRSRVLACITYIYIYIYIYICVFYFNNINIILFNYFFITTVSIVIYVVSACLPSCSASARALRPCVLCLVFKLL